MDKTEVLLGYFHDMADWLQVQAHDYESGRSRHLRNDVDDSAAIAAGLRHRAGNLLQVIAAYKRLKARAV